MKGSQLKLGCFAAVPGTAVRASRAARQLGVGAAPFASRRPAGSLSTHRPVAHHSRHCQAAQGSTQAPVAGAAGRPQQPASLPDAGLPSCPTRAPRARSTVSRAVHGRRRGAHTEAAVLRRRRGGLAVVREDAASHEAGPSAQPVVTHLHTPQLAPCGRAWRAQRCLCYSCSGRRLRGACPTTALSRSGQSFAAMRSGTKPTEQRLMQSTWCG
jgi:hypothetical protein